MNPIRIATSEVQPYEIAHTEAVRKAAPECMVLLKNDGTLPFREQGSWHSMEAAHAAQSREVPAPEM